MPSKKKPKLFKMQPKTLTSDILALEFDRVLDVVADRTLSPASRQHILALPFLTDPELLETELSRVTEFRELLEYGDPFPLERFPDFYDLIKKHDLKIAEFKKSE